MGMDPPVGKAYGGWIVDMIFAMIFGILFDMIRVWFPAGEAGGERGYVVDLVDMDYRFCFV